jgi:hypothetical protein
VLAGTAAHAQFGAQPAGSTTSSQSITVTATVAGTVNSVEVLTTGSPNGDFAAGTGLSNCASMTLAVGGTCTQSVTFTPATPGLRLGAVVLVGAAGGQPAVLGTTYISGTGTGGLGVFAAGNVLPVAGQEGIFSGLNDSELATQGILDQPGGAVLDGAGNMYIADTLHNRIRMVCASATSATIAGTGCAGAGVISTITGNGDGTYSGDGGPAIDATVSLPGYVALDGAGNLYIADTGNNVIRVINAATGVITTVAGIAGASPTPCGAKTDAVGDGCPATQALLNTPEGVTLDAAGNLYIADTNDHRIRKVSATTGIISTIAGSGFTNSDGTGGYNGDNIPAGTAQLNYPWTVAFDAPGNMYIPDSENNRVREVRATGGAVTAASNIVTFAGTGMAGTTSCSDATVAPNLATVWSPSGVAVDAAGNVYIAEKQNAAIRKVSPLTGLISVFVQSNCGSSYYGGAFNSLSLYSPTGLYLDGMGNLYVADTLDMVVDEVQGNFVAFTYTATLVRQGNTSPPQGQTVENDGNAPLDLTTITPATNSQDDTALVNSCTQGETLTVNQDCVVGAVFAPASSPVLTVNTVETPNILVGEDSLPSLAAPNSPLDIQLVGKAEPLTSTTTTVTSTPNPSGLGQSVAFKVTVVTGAGTGALTGTVSISDTFGGNTTTLVSGLALNGSGTATFNISTLQVGIHSITATYNATNDANHTGSTSTPALMQKVMEGTAVNLISSLNPSTVGQSVTFTATVTSSGGVTPDGTVTFFDGSTLLTTDTLAANGIVTYSSSALTNGLHLITAVYNGDVTIEVEGSTSNILSQQVQVGSTITVVSSLNPSTFGAPVTFTATISSTAGSPATGTVSFLDNGALIGAGTLGGTPDTATFIISTLAVGAHPITVSYAGDNYNAASTSAPALSQVVDQAQSVTTVSALPNPGVAGSAETISATVVPAAGTALLTGTVTFSSGGTQLGASALNGSGVATITPTLAPGNYQIVATYPGDANSVGSASAPLAYSVVEATTQTALTVTPDPAVVLGTVTFTATVTGSGATPAGSINFLANGVIVGTSALTSGTATFTDSALPAGSYTMTAQYLGDPTNAASTSPNVSETISLIPTTTVLASATTTGTNPQVVLVAAVVNNSTGGTVPTGTVTFYNGTTSLGTFPVNASGAATLTSNLVSGTNYAVDAVYSGDTDHSASTSQTVDISGTTTGFTVSVTPSTVSVADSQNTTVTVTLTSTNNFADTIGLGCASLPAVVNCQFASVSLKLPAGGTVSTQLTIDTNNPLSGGVSARVEPRSEPGAGNRFSLAGLFLPVSLAFGCIFWLFRRRNARILTLMLVAVLTVGAFVATGCSGYSQATAAPGSYVIQITGTGTATDLIEYENVNLTITR